MIKAEKFKLAKWEARMIFGTSSWVNRAVRLFDGL